MINRVENSVISEFMDTLERLDGKLEVSGMRVDLKLVSRSGYVTVDFLHEHGEWTYEVTVV